MSLKNVIIVGAGGNLGTSVLDTFLKHSSYSITVLSRKDSKSTFPLGVKVIHADYDSISSLTEAFQGQDAVISLVAGSALLVQIKLIDAAIAAGVKYFVPSEFGVNTSNEHIGKIVPVFAPKIQVIDYLKSKESQITWTVVIPGAFFDWGLQNGFLGVSSKTKTAALVDDGKATFSATTLRQIGLATIKVLEKIDETKNRFIFIASHTTSQRDILAVAEKITGEKWTTTNVSAKQQREEGLAKLQKGDFTGIPLLLQSVIFGAEENLGDNNRYELWNEKLGLEQESFEDTIKAALAI